jgi:hypothetical protein
MIHGCFEKQRVLQINSSRTCFATEQARTDSQLHGDGGGMTRSTLRPHAGSARPATLPSVRRPAPGIRSGIRHRPSSIRRQASPAHQASGIRHHAQAIKHQASRTGHQAQVIMHQPISTGHHASAHPASRHQQSLGVGLNMKGEQTLVPGAIVLSISQQRRSEGGWRPK